SRPDGRTRPARRGLPASAASLHRSADECGPATGPGGRRHRDGAFGRGPEPDGPPARSPLPHAPPDRGRPVPVRPAPDQRCRTGPQGRLPPSLILVRSAPAMPTTLIKNAEWLVAWNGAEHVYLRNADIAFRDDRIVFVGRNYDGP